MPVLGAASAARTRAPGNSQALFTGTVWSSGTNTNMASRMAVTSTAAGRSVEIRLVTTQGTGEQSVSGDKSPYTVTASLEYPSGTFWPCYDRNGSKSITVTPGGMPLLYCPGFEVPAAGTKFYFNIFATVAATGGFPAGQYTSGTDEFTVVNTTAIDNTQTATSRPAFNANFSFGSPFITYEPYVKLPTVAWNGDSIGRGKGDPDSAGPQTSDKYTAGGGYLSRALSTDVTVGKSSPRYPFLNLAVNGETLANIMGGVTGRARWQLVTDAQPSNYVSQGGINDVSAGTATATVQALMLAEWTRAANIGCRVFTLTHPPVASASSDSFATTAGQTTFSHEAGRLAINRWKRAGAPIDPTTKTAVAVGTSGALVAGQAGHPLYTVIDICPAVETAQDSGKWITNGTANYPTDDGTHPAPGSCVAIATLLQTSLLPLLA